MEFKLNKIDTDIRKRMQEEIKDDKVHGGQAITVKRDLKDGKSNNTKEEDFKDKEEQKRYITIDGVKKNSEKMNITVEKLEATNTGNFKGRILDVKK